MEESHAATRIAAVHRGKAARNSTKRRRQQPEPLPEIISPVSTFDSPAEDAVERVREQLGAAVSKSGVRVADLFAAWDLDGSGSVDRTEFYHALLMLGIDCDSTVAGALFESLDADASGQVDYRELKAALTMAKGEIAAVLQPGAMGEIDVEGKNAIALRTEAEGGLLSSANGTFGRDGDLAAQISAVLAANWLRVRDLFIEWDTSGDGTIDATELHRSLRLLGLECSRVETEELFARWDVDSSGRIDYRELNSLLRQTEEIAPELRDGAAGEIEVGAKNASFALRSDGPGCTHSTTLGDTFMSLDESGPSLAEQLADALSSRWSRILDLFREWDADGTGLIDVKEFKKALTALGLDASDEEAAELFATFDRDGSGEVEFREFHRALRQRGNLSPEPVRPAAPAETDSIRPLRRQKAKPLVPLRDRLLDLFPRVSPLIKLALGPYADAKGCVDRQDFVEGLLEAGQQPSPRLNAALFSELGMHGRDTKALARALAELFGELLAAARGTNGADGGEVEGEGGGEEEGSLPISSIPAFMRRVRDPRERKNVPFPPLKGASPRVQRAKLVEADSPRAGMGTSLIGRALPRAPHLLSPRDAHKFAGEILAAQARADAIASEEAYHRKQLVLRAQREKSRAAKERAHRARVEGGVSLPPLPLSARAMEFNRNQARLQTNETQLATYQRRGAQLRSMMDRILADPSNPDTVHEAMGDFINDATATPTAPPTATRGRGTLVRGKDVEILTL